MDKEFKKSDRDSLVQTIALTGTPIPESTRLHWRLFLRTHAVNKTVILNLVPGGADLRSGVLLIDSVDSESATGTTVTIPIPAAGGATVGNLIDLILVLKRNQYKFDESGSGCRYWWSVVLSDFEQAKYVDAGSHEYFLQKVAELAEKDPDAFPMPVIQGRFDLQ